MTKKVIALAVAFLLVVALPVFASASAIVTDVLMSHADMYAEMFDGNGNGRPTAITNGDNYRIWDAPGLSTTTAKFVMFNRDSNMILQKHEIEVTNQIFADIRLILRIARKE